MPPKGRKSKKAKTTTYKADPNRRRLQVICTPTQEEQLTQAAEKAGQGKDRSAWILNAALAAAASDGAIAITQPLAGQVIEHARTVGVAPEELIRQWLAGSVAVHAGGAT